MQHCPKKLVLVLVLVLGLGLLLLCGQSGAQEPDAAGSRCAALAQADIEGVVVASAALQLADTPVSGSAMPPMGEDIPPIPEASGLPAFCRVVASARPEPGSDIRFEVWMPAANWDGRLNGGNAGGFAGYINYMDLAAAVRAGQAGVATDTGHRDEAMSGGWARGRPERVRDYGWRGVHLSTVAAKELLEEFYGRGPDHAYFIGCSNGGRQALMAASRFPGDYDGIVAGAPAMQITEVNKSMIHTVQAQSPAGAALAPAQMPRLQEEVLRQCDAIDGQADGLVADPRLCDFDPSPLACAGEGTPGCFSAAQLSALRKIIQGSRDAGGNVVAYGFPVTGAEVGKPMAGLGWEGWITGTGEEPPAHAVFSTELLANFFAEPFAVPEDFDFDGDVARFRAELADDLDARPNMRAFFERGGKLIIWHGWADAAISPLLTIDFYEDILRESGPGAADSVRLFMIPGMQHCFGGTGAAAFGQMSAPLPGTSPAGSVGAAIQAWVEEGRVPGDLVGTRGFPGQSADAPGRQQRLHCAYPARAALREDADPHRAASYTCRKP